MKIFSLTPLDAWFLRDGRPYNEKEANQADAFSLFPPPARTVSGALRSALARANGWKGHGPWTPELNRVFGSSPDNLGALQFTGPFLVEMSVQGKKSSALWPLPLHTLGRAGERWTPTAFLRPAEKPTVCDAGNIKLPVIAPGEKRDGLKPAENAWITVRALQSLLAGELPKPGDIHTPGELWKHEQRVALHRDETTLSTGEGALYSPAYVRLRQDVAVGVGVAGVPDGMANMPSLFPFGGESRLAHCDAWSGEVVPAAPPRERFLADGDGCVAFTVTLLTPGQITPKNALDRFLAPELGKAKVISACVGKSQFIGGWDSLKRAPLPLEPFAPAGSVWFCTAAASDFGAIHSLHGKYFGPHAAHGFGHIVIGLWPATLTSQS